MLDLIFNYFNSPSPSKLIAIRNEVNTYASQIQFSKDQAKETVEIISILDAGKTFDINQTSEINCVGASFLIIFKNKIVRNMFNTTPDESFQRTKERKKKTSVSNSIR